MIEQFRMFASYNQWANRAVYDAAETLSEEEYRCDRGAFFGSLHGTLNHLLSADRIWLRRFTGWGDAPFALNVILYDDLASLRAAREAEDRRIIDFVDGLDGEKLAQPFSYTPITNPVEIRHALGAALTHVFNHQTHHRGQCHTILTSLGKPSLTLDLIYFLRTEGQRWL
ncbi:MAG: DinB family protein [Shinella sp.]|nr:DinB family protein [Shinella sp.]